MHENEFEHDLCGFGRILTRHVQRRRAASFSLASVGKKLAARLHAVYARWGGPSVSSTLESVFADLQRRWLRGRRRPLMVYVSTHDISRFDTGGAKRILGIGTALARRVDVMLIGWLAPDSAPFFRVLGPGIFLLAVPSPKACVRLMDWGAASFSATGLLPLFTWLSRQASGWIFVGPWMHAALREAHVSLARTWYDGHDDFLSFFREHIHTAGEMRVLLRMEEELAKSARTVFFCSEADRAATARRYPAIPSGEWLVIPNGIREEDGACVVPSEAKVWRQESGLTAPVCLFAGSNYGPNDEAVDLISTVLAPHFPEAVFIVLGMRLRRHLNAGGAHPPGNLVFTGLVSEEQKRAIYDLTDVALVPMRSGTGTSLKVPEAIAHGKVVLGTRCGLRGFQSWTRYRSIQEREDISVALGILLGRLAEEPGYYDAACQGAADEIRRTCTWDSLAAPLLERL